MRESAWNRPAATLRARNDLQTMQLIPNIHLVKGVYAPFGTDLPPVEVVCQVVPLNGAAYVWLDGVDHNDPVLLPAQVLDGTRRLGTLRDYLEDLRHEQLGEGFDSLLDLAMEQQVSATVLVRACEIMHEEGSDPSQAITTARQWGIMLCELDQAHRAEFQLVSQGSPTPA